jgi:hypothetical protein
MVRVNNRALKITVIFQVKRKNLFNMLCDRRRRQRRYLLSIVISAEGATNPVEKSY